MAFGLIFLTVNGKVIYQQLTEQPLLAFFFDKSKQVEGKSEAMMMCQEYDGSLATVETKQRQNDVADLMDEAQCERKYWKFAKLLLNEISSKGVTSFD